MIKQLVNTFFIFLFVCAIGHAQNVNREWRNIVLQSPAEWYQSKNAANIAEQVLLYQRDIGGWPKNIGMHLPLSISDKEQLKSIKQDPDGCTIDNGATTLEMYFLAKMYHAQKNEAYKNAFLKGLNYLLEAQYDNGGWPQFYPNPKGYSKHITFNDDAMTGVLILLKHLSDRDGYYPIEIDVDKRIEIEIALQKGIQCVLDCQVKQNGKATAWCAQHDQYNLQPAKARSYELISLSGKETAQIVLFLMSIDHPSVAIVDAVRGAKAWLESVQIKDSKQVYYTLENGEKDKTIVTSEGSRIWARFMDVHTNEAFFCDRDGMRRNSMDDISQERKMGYAWYSTEAEEVFEKYDSWSQRISDQENRIDPNKKIKTVAKDGTGDYSSIQSAIYDCKSFPDYNIEIQIKNGIYYESIHIGEWNPRIHIVGESMKETVLVFDNYFDQVQKGRNSTFETSSVLIEGDDTMLENLSIYNAAGEVGQAIALSVHADRVHIKNCVLKGHQDVLYVSGDGNKMYFENCQITGSTDFIFGNASAFFEDCKIESVSNSYITAASTTEHADYGLVFWNCQLTAIEGVNQVYLGRPWRPFAKTVFVHCNMGAHVVPEGWHNWSNKEAEKTVYYAEINSKGPGFNKSKRVPFGHVLSLEKADEFKKELVLKSIEYPDWYSN